MTGDAASIAAACGVVTAAVVGAATRDVRAALRAAMELFTAAGLLHLTASASWRALATAAIILAVRRLVATSLGSRGASSSTA